MDAAFFHDERFYRDASGVYYSSGTLPYRVFERYLQHFGRLVMVGRLSSNDASPMRSVASGPGVEFDCVPDTLPLPRRLLAISQRARAVLGRVDCAFIRLPSMVGLIAAREAEARGIPWLAEVVGDAFASLWHHGSWRGKAAALPIHLLTRRSVSRAGSALYVCSRLHERYPTRRDWESISDVLIESPRPAVLEARLTRIATGAQQRSAALGLIGSYDVTYKGHETALSALRRLQRPGRSVSLRCIGIGDPSRWRARAERLGVGANVEFGGPLPHGEQVLRWLDELDLCIMPSFTEGLPRSLVEAMSRALPAVGSAVGAIPELLEERALHRPGDARGLAHLVDRLLGDASELEAQARRNWNLAARYAGDVLERRRQAFLEGFAAEVIRSRRRP